MLWGVTCADGKKREELSDYEEYREWLQNRRDEYQNRVKKSSWDTEVSSLNSLTYTLCMDCQHLTTVQLSVPPSTVFSQ